MGKVVKTVAVLALAVGIAVAAPYLAGFLATTGTLAFTAATAAIGLSLSAAAAIVMKALAGPPSATVSLIPGSIETKPTAFVTAPRSPGRWRDPFFYPWGRFAIERTTLDCMTPLCPERWIVIDRRAAVRSGDYVVIRVGDQRRYYWGGGRWKDLRFLYWGLTRTPMCKRFVGIGGAVLLFECTKPPRRFETSDAGVQVIYRIRGKADSFLAAWRMVRAMKRDPKAFNDRLATAGG